jgi:hypothetical protein
MQRAQEATSARMACKRFEQTGPLGGLHLKRMNVNCTNPGGKWIRQHRFTQTWQSNRVTLKRAVF